MGHSTGVLLKHAYCLWSILLHSEGWALSIGPTCNLLDNASAELHPQYHVRNGCVTMTGLLLDCDSETCEFNKKETYLWDALW